MCMYIYMYTCEYFCNVCCVYILYIYTSYIYIYIITIII